MNLSIAMCTFNGAAYLAEQLESLAAQTRLPDELVVNDDQSTDDGTREIVAAFTRTAPFPVRLSVNEKTLGSKQNFAKAIDLCRGDIIFLCDQDDVWGPDKLARIEETFRLQPETGLVFSDAEVVSEDLVPMRHLADDFNSECRAQLREGRAFHALLHNYLVTGATMAFASRFKSLVLPIPDETILQHDAWIALIIAATAPVVFLPEALIKYRQHLGQQIGVSIEGTKYEQRSSPLIDSVNQSTYPNPEIHAFKTVYARIINRCPGLISPEKLKDIQRWIVRLENERSVVANEKAPPRKQKSVRKMQKFIDSRTIRVAPYIWRDYWTQIDRGKIQDLATALARDAWQGIRSDKTGDR
jgi:glycosyltransferase involved in cell wall biosynthesis